MSNEPTACRQTPLYDWHAANGGRIVDFSGWAMPVQYTSIIKEHQATRQTCGLTDVSHMGRLRFEGRGAAEFLACLLTRRVHGLKENQVRYSLVTNDDGGILDDVLVGYYHNSYGQPYYIVVVNASNRAKIVEWVHRHLPPERANAPGKEVIFSDITYCGAMFAIQGPRAVDVLQPLVDTDLSLLKYYNGEQTRILHPRAKRQGALVSRTGYTGEDGFEITVGADIAIDFWSALIESGESFGAVPTGIGARDTLRLEAGMPLYGHEISEQTNPFEAGLGFACHLSGYDFPGRDALLAIQGKPLARRRVGFELEGRRAARDECSVFRGDEEIGITTSGTFAPTLEKSVAIGYVASEYAEPGTSVEIDIRGRRVAAVVVELPFYRREKKGKKTS